MLAYEVLLHVNFIINFRPLTESNADWLVHHSFRWRLERCNDWRLGAPRCNFWEYRKIGHSAMPMEQAPAIKG
jgi:hypothetical protein